MKTPPGNVPNVNKVLATIIGKILFLLPDNSPYTEVNPVEMNFVLEFTLHNR